MNPSQILFNPFALDFRQNPYPTYARLRQEDPVHWSMLKTWVITRYDDAQAILKDERFQGDNLPLRLQQKSAYLKEGDLFTLSKTIDKWLFFQNPPEHTRLKALLSKTFSPSSVEAMRPAIQETVNSLLAKVAHYGKMDVINDFASPLSTITITKILGLPLTDYHKLASWSYNLSFIIEQIVSLDNYKRHNELVRAAIQYLLKFIEQQKENPNLGLINQLLTSKNQEGKLTEDEIVSFCIMLLMTGQETTKNLIGNAILALLKHPESLQELKNNPSLINKAVEELLRYDTPVQAITRLAKEDIIIRGKNIHKGEYIIICLGAANRDIVQFYEPDKINFHRQNISLSFGGGIHLCLGMFLAKVQSQIAINSLVQSLSNLELATEQVEWHERMTLRGLKTLPVKFTPFVFQ